MLLAPVLGAVLMSASTVIVAINARMLRLKTGPKPEADPTPKLEANAATTTMKEAKSVIKEIKDPVCGMTVDPATALHAERDGETSYFRSEHCRAKFLSTPAGAKP